MRPELAHMLPSVARSTLTGYFLEKLEASKLDCYGDPAYRLVNAIGEFNDCDDSYALQQVVPCYVAARKEYDARHPKTWNVDLQVAGRVSLGKTALKA